MINAVAGLEHAATIKYSILTGSSKTACRRQQAQIFSLARNRTFMCGQHGT